MAEDKYTPISEYGLQNYSIGLKAGQKVRLKDDLVVQDHTGKPTGKVNAKGEIWTVLSGVETEPDIIWLRQPDGERHTWDAGEFFQWFELFD